MIVWIYYLLLLIFLIAGLALVAITMPGLWLMTAAVALYGIVTHFRYVGAKTLVALFLISLLAELIEVWQTGSAAKKAGGGRRAMIGGVVGGLLGGIFLTFLIPIPVLGTIAGVCIGSFLGSFGMEYFGGEEISAALRVGLGAARGRAMGIVTKLLIGIAMLLLTLIVALPIGGTKPKAPPMPRSATSQRAPM